MVKISVTKHTTKLHLEFMDHSDTPVTRDMRTADAQETPQHSHTESVMSYRTEMGNVIERRLEQANPESFKHMELLFKQEPSHKIEVKTEFNDAQIWRKISEDCLTKKAITNIKL